MDIHFDFNNKTIRVCIDGEYHVCGLHINKLNNIWSAAHMGDIQSNGRVYSVTWQVWQESTQYVKVHEFQEHSKKEPWIVISGWTHVPGKSLEQYGCDGKVNVEGSPYGDFRN